MKKTEDEEMKPKPKLEHPFLRWLIKIFAKGYALHKNPAKKKKGEVLQ